MRVCGRANHLGIFSGDDVIHPTLIERQEKVKEKKMRKYSGPSWPWVSAHGLIDYPEAFEDGECEVDSLSFKLVNPEAPFGAVRALFSKSLALRSSSARGTPETGKGMPALTTTNSSTGKDAL